MVKLADRRGTDMATSEGALGAFGALGAWESFATAAVAAAEAGVPPAAQDADSYPDDETAAMEAETEALSRMSASASEAGCEKRLCMILRSAGLRLARSFPLDDTLQEWWGGGEGREW